MVTELIGYLATALVVFSFAMTSIVRLRAISLAGCIVFVVYGVLIHSWPVVATNGAIAVINVWLLRREIGPRSDLAVVSVSRDDAYLMDFLRSHREDIHRTQPTFRSAHLDDIAFVITRDGLPAGVLLGAREGTDLFVDLDYVLPSHRDSRIGRWLYDDGSAALRNIGVRRVIMHAETDIHRRYLESLGFVDDGERWIREL